MRAIIICLLLAGCASGPITRDISIPVQVSCVEAAPIRPIYETETIDIDAASEFDLMMATLRDWLRSREYESRLEVQVKACQLP